MEVASRLEGLQKLRERLCTETEPSQLYRTLKELSSRPGLRDILEEIDFRKTIKLLKKQQLLLPFAKDLAAQWSEGSHFGPQPEPRPQDFASQSSPMTKPRRDSPEDKDHEREPASQPLGEGGREVFEVSSSSPHQSQSRSTHASPDRTSTGSPSTEPVRRKWPRESSVGTQLAAGSQVREGQPPKRGVGAPWQPQGVNALSSKPAAGPAKQHQSLTRVKTPGPWIQEDQQATSLKARLQDDSDSSDSSDSSPSAHKRKRKSSWKAEAHSPSTQVPRVESQSCRDLNLLLDASPFPELTSTHQACFSQGEGPEDSSLHTDPEAAPWACRINLKTPVYSGRTPARRLPREWHQGRFAKPACTWETHCQSPLEGECQLWSQQEEESRPKTHTGKPRDTQTETHTHLRLQQARELKLKALAAHIRSSQAKKHQGLQTKLTAFHALTTNLGQHADSGPRPKVSPKNGNSLSQDSGTDLVKSALRPTLEGRSKTHAKKPAPLMAKALKDYKIRCSRK